MIPHRIKKASLADLTILPEVKEFTECLFTPAEPIELIILNQSGERRSITIPAGELFNSILINELAEENSERNNYNDPLDVQIKPMGNTRQYLHAACDRLGGMKEVQHRLKLAGLPEPTITMNSEPGISLFWKLEEPITLSEWAITQKHIASALGATQTDCLWLPGFVNHAPRRFRTVQEVKAVIQADRVFQTDTINTICRTYQTKRFASVVWQKTDCVNFRLIDQKGKTKNHFTQASGIMDPEHWASLTEDNQTYNVYAGVNPVDPASRLKGKGKGVKLARCVYVDFDPAPEQSISLLMVSARIRELDLPKPTMIVSSGRGFHAYWSLKDSITDLSVFCGLQSGLIDLFNSSDGLHVDTRIKDAPRIMRMPGFINQKNNAYCSIVQYSPKNRYPQQVIQEVLSGAGAAVRDISIRLPLTDTEQDSAKDCKTSVISDESVSLSNLKELVRDKIWENEDFSPCLTEDRHAKRIKLAASVYGRCPSADIEIVMKEVFRPWFDLYQPVYPDKKWNDSARDFYTVWADRDNQTYFHPTTIMADVDVTLTVREKIKILMTRASEFFKMPNGTFHLSHRQMALGCGCTRRAVEKALSLLLRDRFVKVTKKGDTGKKINGLANQYRLL